MKQLLFSFVLVVLLGSCTQTNKVSSDRPTNWAQKVSVNGMHNLYKIDSLVYRSEQPHHKEMKELQSMGISTVLNLRHKRNDNWKGRKTKLKLEHIPINTWKVSYDELVNATGILVRAKEPILVHCWHGSDRTGAIIACYRIVKFNWTKEEAIKELVNGGYGFHKNTFQNIVQLINSIDVEKFKMDVTNRNN
jgi:protein tyrosine/serine phosphatase